MSKSKKTPIFKYGIEITKPFSKTMYDHNEICAREMRSNIRHAWSNEVIKFNANDEWPTEGKIVDIQKCVCAVGYGEGFTIDEVQKDFLQQLDNMVNWQLHEEYSYMSFKGLVPRTRFMMVGFDWEKHDYSYCTDIDLSPVLDKMEVEDGPIEKVQYDDALNENFDGREEIEPCPDGNGMQC